MARERGATRISENEASAEVDNGVGNSGKTRAQRRQRGGSIRAAARRRISPARRRSWTAGAAEQTTVTLEGQHRQTQLTTPMRV